MARDDAVLLDIIRAAQLIQAFTDGLDRDSLLADLKTQSAVLHQLLVIGEAVRRLSPEFRARLPGVPWTPIARMRNRLIHEYHSVDLDIVWTTVLQDTPSLLAQLAVLLPQKEDEP